MSYEIEVYCTGRTLRDGSMGTSHADRRTHVARLNFLAKGELNGFPGDPTAKPEPEDSWTPNMVSRIRARKEQRRSLDPKTHRLVEYITDDGREVSLEDAHTDEDWAERGEDFKRAHLKIRLRCPQCGQDYQGRMETLTPYLDKLREAGWSEVSLGALGAILRT